MRFLHSMIRVRDLDAALDFFCNKLGLRQVRRRDHEGGRFTLVFLETGTEGETVWVDAAPPEGHVIINTGIMLERISNGIIPSGWHRVVADPDHDGERYSVVQF